MVLLRHHTSVDIIIIKNNDRQPCHASILVSLKDQDSVLVEKEGQNVGRPETRKFPITNRHLPHLLQESSHTDDLRPGNVVTLHLGVPIARRQNLCLADSPQDR